MINQKSLERVEKSTFRNHFCKPIYDTYGFAQIPATIFTLFGVSKGGLPLDTIKEGPHDIVLLFLIDGFGWHLLEKYKNVFPFLQRFYEKGIVSKLTSQFPSTTAPQITCINTGLEVGQSGVYEWFYYEPQVDSVIAPLPFSYAGDHENGTLLKNGFLPSNLLPTSTIYQMLKTKEIPSFVFQHENTAHTPYSQVVFNGAEVFPYSNLEIGLKKLQDKVEKTKRGYFYFYYGDVDAMA